MEIKNSEDIVSIKIVKDYSIQYSQIKASKLSNKYKLFENILLDMYREKF